ncbi:jumonji domain containing protein [Pseudohyphozyma bogoriensis]|nr:jumonji domain containing protein [Pseudohyphozyma bogoriensis]
MADLAAPPVPPSTLLVPPSPAPPALRLAALAPSPAVPAAPAPADERLGEPETHDEQTEAAKGANGESDVAMNELGPDAHDDDELERDGDESELSELEEEGEYDDDDGGGEADDDATAMLLNFTLPKATQSAPRTSRPSASLPTPSAQPSTALKRFELAVPYKKVETEGMRERVVDRGVSEGRKAEMEELRARERPWGSAANGAGSASSSATLPPPPAAFEDPLSPSSSLSSLPSDDEYPYWTGLPPLAAVPKGRKRKAADSDEDYEEPKTTKGRAVVGKPVKKSEDDASSFDGPIASTSGSTSHLPTPEPKPKPNPLVHRPMKRGRKKLVKKAAPATRSTSPKATLVLYPPVSPDERIYIQNGACLMKDALAGGWEFRGLSDDEEDAEEPVFPEVFNEVFTKEHASKIRSSAAEHLVETMEKEEQHANREGCLRVKTELAVRASCDTCLTVVLSGAWLCRDCGRELCFECFERLQAVEKGEVRREEQGEHEKRLKKCQKMKSKAVGIDHRTELFMPITRFRRSEVAELVQEMRKWREAHPLKPPREVEGRRLQGYYESDEGVLRDRQARPFMVVPVDEIHPRVLEWGTCALDDDAFARGPTAEDMAQAQAKEKALNAESPEFFRSLWSKGEAMVVDVFEDGDRVGLNWTPEYFVERFGDVACTIASNRSGEEVRSTVGEFFSRFGRDKGERGEESLKIKDWPATSDFRAEFPELFKDFMSALPAPFVTRRDGVLNVAAHTPINANPPDLGPKGYFSERSDDGPGGSGSTKLHTINLMMWSGDAPDGLPGMAAWDLFRAEDSAAIRDFLYGLMAKRSIKGLSREYMAQNMDDPIHGQSFYLDRALREQLFEEKGVRSWRIWQKPGQVVFIPAGCAHQVCNFADCIKIASDFVSIENVARCWNVTDEFRAQTKEKKLWRTDVLQLKSQLLWAWKSCDRHFPQNPSVAASTSTAPLEAPLDEATPSVST